MKKGNLNYYVYRLNDPITGQYYFGSRGYEGDINLDSYMGSMKTWIPIDSKRLVKTIIKSGFVDMDSAIRYESNLIEKCVDDDLNENYHIPTQGFHTRGKIFTKEQREKLSKAKTGIKLPPASEERKKKIGDAHRGRKYPNGERNGRGVGRVIGPMNSEHKQKLSKSKKGKIRNKLICPNCGKVGGDSAMKRWHFDNCKYNCL